MTKKLALVCTVWGERFTEFFGRYCIASLLALDNFPYLASRYDVSLLLYTDDASFELLRQSSNYQRLDRLIDIRPIFLHSSQEGHWEPWHHAVLNYSDEFFAFAIVIPDCVYVHDCLRKVSTAIERADIVYYSMPEVCLETVVPALSARLTAEGVLDLDGIAVADLFISHINPKHAVADLRARFFVTHPEYIIATATGRVALTALGNHPLAFRSNQPALAFTFNPVTSGARLEFLEILGVGCEPAFKYIEQYFRWPALNRSLSRMVNLASWAYTFREAGAADYSNTEAAIAVHHGHATQQSRLRQTHPRTRLANHLLQYGSNVFRVYSAAREEGDALVRQSVALAAALPGLRRILTRWRAGLTILLPTRTHQFAATVAAIEEADQPQLLFVQFLLLHVLPGRLRLRPDQSFTLRRLGAAAGGQTAITFFDSALSRSMADRVVGKLASGATELGDNLLAYRMEVEYGPLSVLLRNLRGGLDVRAAEDAFGQTLRRQGATE